MAASPTTDPRARARRRALGVAGVLLLLFAVNAIWIGRSLRRLGSEPVTVGKAAPELVGPTLTGATFRLADLRGKVVLLDFWATWCAPCVAELPVLARLQASRGPRGLAVVGVNIEGDGARRAVTDELREAGVGYPNVLDEGEARARYGITALPHLVLVDRAGVVRRQFLGATAPEDLEAAVDALLRGAPVPPPVTIPIE
jgi:cytochrome c biogenesis protein CcmG/thiol:disulfide interchange protein DsbE